MLFAKQQGGTLFRFFFLNAFVSICSESKRGRNDTFRAQGQSLNTETHSIRCYRVAGRGESEMGVGQRVSYLVSLLTLKK